MTVQVSNSVKYYVGDGSTLTFDYDFIVFSQSHLKVYLGSVEQSTGFTVSGIGSQSGGSVVFSVPPVNGTEVILIRDVPFTQLFDYVAYDSFPAEAHERNVDLLVMMCQYLRGVTDRAMVTAIGQSVWDMKGQEITNAGEATAPDSVPTLDQTEAILSSAISQVIPGISFTYAGFTFVSGGTLTSPAQVVYDPATSSFWSWAGPFPKTVAAGSDPLVDPQWINQTENSYRTQGETNDRKMWEAVSALLGYELVAGSFQEGGTISDPIHVLWDKIGGAVYYRTAGDSVVVPPLSSPGVGWTVMIPTDAAALATDAAALATAVAALAARVAALEARKFTTLIPATYPSGAPHDTHETVDAALPANIAANTRYVLTNPFGVNTRVHVTVELYLNGKWADPGEGGNLGSGTISAGTTGHYVQGEGIVVQTGNSGVANASVLLGGGHGITSTSAVTSAPCRVAIKKWEE